MIGDSCCLPDIFLADQYVAEELRAIGPKSIDDCDLLIVNGVITEKMVPYIKDCYERLVEPKLVIAFGTCTVSGQPFETLKLSDIIPVSVSIAGCSPGAMTLKSALDQIKQTNMSKLNESEPN